MPSVVWKYRPGVLDSNIVARDQLIALKGDGSVTSQLIPKQTIGMSSIETERSGVTVVPTSIVITTESLPTIGFGADVLMIIDPSEFGSKLVDVASHFDEIWVTPGSLYNDLSTAGIDEEAIRVFAPYSAIEIPEKQDMPPTDKPIALLHEPNHRMVEIHAFIRAWLSTEWTKDVRLVVSSSGLPANSLPNLVRAIRNDLGGKKGHSISVINNPTVDELDACLSISQIVCCVHDKRSGWRPLAMKAAMAGRMVISSVSGQVSKHVSASKWLNAPDRSKLHGARIPELLAEAYLVDLLDPPTSPAKILPQITSQKSFVALCSERARALTGAGIL